MLVGCATTPTSVPLSKRAREECTSDGIPYYLPRPYLLVTKNFAVSETTTKSESPQPTDENKKTNKTSGTMIVVTTTVSAPSTSTNADVFAWQIIFLPDLEQKYGLRFKRGWGSQETSINLVDGWKLAGINSKSDAKTAETIAAIGTVIKEAASAASAVVSPVKMAEYAAPTTTPGTSEKPKEVRVGFWLYDIGDPRQFRLAFKWTSDEDGPSDQMKALRMNLPKD